MLLQLAAFVVVIAGIIAAKPIIIPFLLAAFLATICVPPLLWLRTRGIPTFISILLLVLLIVALETGLAGLISKSMAEFSHSLPLYQERLAAILKDLIRWTQSHGIEVTEKVIMDQFDPGKLMKLAANMLNNLFSVLTNTFMIILIFIFMLLEATGFPIKLKAAAKGSDTYLLEYEKIVKGINRYLGLKVVTSLSTSIIITIGLLLIGVDFAAMWGVVAFLLNFIPTIGSLLAAIPPTLLALVQLGPGGSLATALLYLVTNVTIGSFIEPRILGSGVGLSTLIIFVSMAFWGWVLGPVGMLLSVPLTMTLKIALNTNEKTRYIAMMLGSNAEAAKVLAHHETTTSKEHPP